MPRLPLELALIGLVLGNVAGPALAGPLRPGFDGQVLPATDDGSSGPVQLGFTLNFYGRSFSLAYINNNGNVTLDNPLSSFTPFELQRSSRAILAPFFADVDTTSTGRVTYGPGTLNGRPAFGISWVDVGYYPGGTDKVNRFQLILVNRADTGAGNFDIEFNYERIDWDTGSASGMQAARAGWSNGSRLPGTSFELPGSGVVGTFLDSNRAKGLVHHSFNSSQLGHYVFAVRNRAHRPCEVPEPGSLALMVLGTALVSGHQWYRRRVAKIYSLRFPTETAC